MTSCNTDKKEALKVVNSFKTILSDSLINKSELYPNFASLGIDKTLDSLAISDDVSEENDTIRVHSICIISDSLDTYKK